MTEQKSRMWKKRNKAKKVSPTSLEQKATDPKTKAPNKKRSKRKKRPRLRLIPIWLRIVIVIVLIGGCFLLGLIVGYGMIGDGEPGQVLQPETWYHIIDIIRGHS